LSREHRVFECPNPETVVAAHRVAATATAVRLLRFWAGRNPLRQAIRKAFARFRPDAAITDYEYFVPLAAREAGIRCLSLDHQHVIPFCGAAVPWFRYPDFLATLGSLRGLFSAADEFLVTSFFQPPRSGKVRIFPPLLRPSVLRRVPGDGNIPLKWLFAELLEAGYAGPLEVEIIGPAITAEGAESALRRTIDYLDDLLAELGV